jgi:hypothetical protein
MRVIYKKVWNENRWDNCAFYELNKTPACLEWLRDHYGYPKYSVTWWKKVDAIWVKDKIYTHLKLCE